MGELMPMLTSACNAFSVGTSVQLMRSNAVMNAPIDLAVDKSVCAPIDRAGLQSGGQLEAW